MSGSVERCEVLLRQKTKVTADLDSLRDEVKALESSLHTKRPPRRAANASSSSGAPGDSSSNAASKATTQSQQPRSGLLMQSRPAALAATQSAASRGSAGSDKRYSETHASPKSALLAPMPAPTPLQTLGLFDPDNQTPLPMVADSVFRDGMISALVCQGGWSADQALAALVATQSAGTVAAARHWLHTVLQTGNAMTGVSPRHAMGTRTNDSPLRSRDTTLGLSSASASSTAALEPPVPAARSTKPRSLFGAPVSPPLSRESTAAPRQQQQQLSRLPPLGPEFLALASMPVLPPTSTLPALRMPPGSSSSSTVGSTQQLAATAVAGGAAASSPIITGIPIRIKRPTDGTVIELRRRFLGRDLLSTVLTAFLEEQGEAATMSASREESDKAAEFARLVSSSTSRWALLATAPPKKAYSWDEMDRTTLSDAGIHDLGGLFAMQHLVGVRDAVSGGHRGSARSTLIEYAPQGHL